MRLAGAMAADFTVGVGADYSAGTYGSFDRTNVYSVPLFARYKTGPFTLRLSGSWIRTIGNGTIVPSSLSCLA